MSTMYLQSSLNKDAQPFAEKYGVSADDAQLLQ